MIRGCGKCARFIVLALGLCTLSVPVVAAGKPGKAVAVEPQQGGTLTVGINLEARGFDPLQVAYQQLGDRSVITAVEERLFRSDGKGGLVPELALTATAAQDGKSWTIALRRGVFFHDGTPFNADAVVEHWQRMLDARGSFSGSAYIIEPVQSVQKVDDYTVIFTLKHPWGPFLTMLSEAQWTGAFIPSPKSIREKTLNRAPVGTGPFVFKEWVASDRLVVVKNPAYWRAGKPYLASVVFRPVADPEARFSALRSGALDLILTDSGPQILQAENDRALKLYRADTSGPYTFILNTDKPPLDDARVRRALAHAWNQDVYLKENYQGILAGVKDPFGGSISCGDDGYRAYDPAKARMLAGQYGKPISIELLEDDTPRGRKSGELMQRLFKEIGVELRVVQLPEGELVKRVKSGNYLIADWRMMDLNDMGPYLNVCLQSEGIFNFSNYRSKTMDALLRAQQESSDEKARQKALCGVASLINEDAIYLYAGGRRFNAVARSQVKGIDRFDHGIVRVSDAWMDTKSVQEKKAKPKAKAKAQPKAKAKKKRVK